MVIMCLSYNAIGKRLSLVPRHSIALIAIACLAHSRQTKIPAFWGGLLQRRFLNNNYDSHFTHVAKWATSHFDMYFFRMKICEIEVTFHGSLFQWVKSTMFRHWFRYLSEAMMVSKLTYICVTQPQLIRVQMYDYLCFNHSSCTFYIVLIHPFDIRLRFSKM